MRPHKAHVCQVPTPFMDEPVWRTETESAEELRRKPKNLAGPSGHQTGRTRRQLTGPSQTHITAAPERLSLAKASAAELCRALVSHGIATPQTIPAI